MAKTADLELLLAHTDWLRALARRLVGSAAADDVVHDTLVAAMSSPPDAARPARPWLGSVLRNVTRMRFRGDARRERREQAAAIAPNEPARPDEAVQRLETHRAVCTHVLELDEPFRTTLVEHYFDGRSLADIARTHGIPEGTVRWRHKQAIDRLRAQLDAGAGGDRRAWVAALAPFALPSTTPFIVGGLVMNKLIIGVLAAAVAAAVVWKATDRASSSSSAAVATTPAPAGPSQPATGPATGTAPAAAVPRHVTKFASSNDRQRVADQITSAQAIRNSLPRPQPSLPSPTADEDSDKETIRTAMREAIPFVTDCYSDALPTLSSPNLDLKAHFILRSDPDIGMIVDSVDPLVDANGQVLPAKFDECMRSTLQTLEMPPLAQSGDMVSVNYPLMFRPAGPDDGSGSTHRP